MKNRAASRLIRSAFDEGAVKEAAIACREEIGGAPSLVVAHFTSDWQDYLHDFVEVVQVYGYAAQIIGCTADGLISDAGESENASGCSLLFLRLPETKLDVSLIRTANVERFHVPKAGTGEEPGTWMVLCNPYLVHAEEWMQRWNTITRQAPTYGALASGVSGNTGTAVFSNHETDDLACVGVRFRGGMRLEGVVSQGCRPIGMPYTITRVNGNVVSRLGSRRAFEVLEEAFESLSIGERKNARGNLFAGLALSEYVEEHERGNFLVRNILGGDPETGAVAVGAFPRQGQTMQFQIRDREAAHDDLTRLCEGARQHWGQPFASMLFSCTGRGSRMFGHPGHDAGVVLSAFGKLPVSGFFSNGEIGPVGGTNFIHGYTASTAFFYDA